MSKISIGKYYKFVDSHYPEWVGGIWQCTNISALGNFRANHISGPIHPLNNSKLGKTNVIHAPYMVTEIIFCEKCNGEKICDE